MILNAFWIMIFMLLEVAYICSRSSLHFWYLCVEMTFSWLFDWLSVPARHNSSPQVELDFVFLRKHKSQSLRILSFPSAFSLHSHRLRISSCWGLVVPMVWFASLTFSLLASNSFLDCLSLFPCVLLFAATSLSFWIIWCSPSAVISSGSFIFSHWIRSKWGTPSRLKFLCGRNQF